MRLDILDNKAQIEEIKKTKRNIKILNIILVLVLILALALLINIVSPKLFYYIKWSKTPIVVIDPGHGGEQKGAESLEFNRVEKDDNLAFAFLVAKNLEKRGVKVIMTRKEDITLDLESRVKIAEDNSSHLFVSLHRNDSIIPSSGIEVWISSKKDPNEIILGENIYERLLKLPYTLDRGVRVGTYKSESFDYYVNKNTTMPSAIVETGFVTNKEDNELFDKYKEKYASAIACGIIDSLKEIYKSELVCDTK